MSPRPLALAAAIAAVLTLAGCGGDGHPAAQVTASPSCSPAPRPSLSPRGVPGGNPGASPFGQPSGPNARRLIAGDVVSYKSGRLVVLDRRSNQEETIAVDASTQVRIAITPTPVPSGVGSVPSPGVNGSAGRPAIASASPVPPSRLKAGQLVNVTATQRDDGTLLATAVVIQTGCGFASRQANRATPP